MLTNQCTKCGKERLAASLNEDGICLVCAPRNDDSLGTEATSKGQAPNKQSSSKAIEVVHIVNQLNAIAGIILALAVGLVAIDQKSGVSFGISFVIALVTLVSWALIRMFIGIAQDIKAIRAKVESS